MSAKIVTPKTIGNYLEATILMFKEYALVEWAIWLGKSRTGSKAVPYWEKKKKPKNQPTNKQNPKNSELGFCTSLLPLNAIVEPKNLFLKKSKSGRVHVTLR